MTRKQGLAAALAVWATLSSGPPLLAQTPDKWPDFIVRPPPPFQAEPSSHPQNDKVWAIRSWSGFPRSANRDGTLCSAAFKGAPQNAALTQGEINAQIKGEDWRKLARGALVNIFTTNAETVVEDDGVAGLELVLTPKLGPDAANVRLVMTIAETPKGRATLSCAVPASDLDAALPQLRALRQTIQIPK